MNNNQKKKIKNKNKNQKRKPNKQTVIITIRWKEIKKNMYSIEKNGNIITANRK